jgi:hypothetical protein
MHVVLMVRMPLTTHEPLLVCVSVLLTVVATLQGAAY